MTLIFRAGAPPHSSPAGTLVNGGKTDPAATTAPSPISTPAITTTPTPTVAPRPTLTVPRMMRPLVMVCGASADEDQAERYGGEKKVERAGLHGLCRISLSPYTADQPKNKGA